MVFLLLGLLRELVQHHCLCLVLALILDVLVGLEGDSVGEVQTGYRYLAIVRAVWELEEGGREGEGRLGKPGGTAERYCNLEILGTVRFS